MSIAYVARATSTASAVTVGNDPEGILRIGPASTVMLLVQ